MKKMIYYFLFLFIAVPSYSKWTVVIDPGHYQIDPDGRIINGGASGITESGKKITEWKENLRVAECLKKIFMEKVPDMVKVYLTHDGPTLLGNRERAVFANDLDADIFVRIHMNSSFSAEKYGTETYYYWEDSKQATEIVHAHLVEFTKRYGGVHRHFERGLKYLRVPGITVELGYLSNIREATKLADPLYQKGMANAIYQCIMDFLKYTCAETEVIIEGITEPRGIALDKEGFFWVADWGSKNIVRMNPIGDTIQSIALKHKPSCVACVNDKIYIATSKNYIEVYNFNGELVKRIGKVGLRKGQFRDINKIAHYQGKLFIVEEGNHRIQVYDLRYKKTLCIFGKWKRHGGRFEDITSISCYKGKVYVSDFERNTLFIFTQNGNMIRQIHYPSNKYHLNDITSSQQGIFLVGGSEGDIVLIKLIGNNLVTLREFKTIHQKRRPNFPAIAVDEDNIWITDASSGRIVRIKTAQEEELHLCTLFPHHIKGGTQRIPCQRE